MLLPAAIIAPAGLIIYGLAAEDRLHWIGYFCGVAMSNWGAYFFFTGTLAYAVDSYNANVSEMLIAMCCGKQLISFAFGVCELLKDGKVLVFLLTLFDLRLVGLGSAARICCHYCGRLLRCDFRQQSLCRALHGRGQKNQTLLGWNLVGKDAPEHHSRDDEPLMVVP